ncbi:MAG: DUF3341 domain-containing protein [Candidatus Methylacidiphilales bacterium]
MSETVEQGKLWAIGGELSSAAELYEAAKKVRSLGFKHWDVYSPYPIHGMDAAMGLGPSPVSKLSLLGGITGGLTGFVLVYYTGYIDYPLIVQGKPFFAFEPTFPVYFELTILLTAFATLFGMLLFNLLPRWNHPLFNWDRFKRVTDDKFFVVIEARDPLFSEEYARQVLTELGCTGIEEIRDDP